MPRAIWKGAISFGLVTIPVGLHSAVDSRGELSFRLLHRKDASRIDYKRFCEAENVEVPWSEIVKGYEYAKNKYVVMTDEDFAKARVVASHTFDIRAFVPAADIDYLYFDHPYYLVPAGRGGARAYGLLRDTLRKAGRVGIGTIVLRQREHLAALEPVKDALALTTMRFAHEIRSTAGLDLPQAGANHARREMQLAEQLVETLAAPWNPRDYRDTYTDVLKQAIEQKVEGKAISIPSPDKPRRVVNLMEALQRSLKANRKPGVRKLAGKRKAAA